MGTPFGLPVEGLGSASKDIQGQNLLGLSNYLTFELYFFTKQMKQANSFFYFFHSQLKSIWNGAKLRSGPNLPLPSAFHCLLNIDSERTLFATMTWNKTSTTFIFHHRRNTWVHNKYSFGSYHIIQL